MKNNTFTAMNTRGGYGAKSLFSLCRLGAVSTTCFALMVASAWGEEKSLLEKAIDLSGKHYSQGVLDYLNEQGLLSQFGVDRQSSFSLTEIMDTSGLSPEELVDGIFLRFDVSDSIWYYDRRTGMRVNTPEADSFYREVTIKEIVPHYFTHAFKDEFFESGVSVGSDGKRYRKYTTGTGSESYTTDYLNYTIDKRVFEFLYDKENASVVYQNNPNVDDITGGVFKGGRTSGSGYRSKEGAAIRLDASIIGNIKADFIDNISGGFNGGAIALIDGSAVMGAIDGTFISNQACKEGGAIWVYGYNQRQPEASNSLGADIAPYIKHINGVFIDNGINDTTTNAHRGGAIYVGGEDKKASDTGPIVDLIEGLFIANHVTSMDIKDPSEDGAVGGAIAIGNRATIKNIIGDFIGNYITKELGYREGYEPDPTNPDAYHAGDTHGGAIMSFKKAHIGNIIGDFYGNNIQANQGYGGAIANQSESHIDSITGGFVRNNVSAGLFCAAGGAIYNNRGATIGEISGNFIRNFVTNNSDIWGDSALQNGFVSGGAIANYYSHYNQPSTVIDTIKGKFYGNYARSDGNSYAQGGAISNAGKEGMAENLIGTIEGDFISNYAEANHHFARGGAIFTDANSRIKLVSGNFYFNYAKSQESSARGGAIRNGGNMDEIENAIFVGNYAWSVDCKDGNFDSSKNYPFHPRIDESNLQLIGSNYPKEISGAHGGAIFNEGTLTISANKGNTTLFAGNYIVNGEEDREDARDYEAIYCYSDLASGGATHGNKSRAVLTLKSIEHGYIIFEDKINGNDYDLNLTGDSSSYIIFNNLVQYATIQMEDINLILFGAPDEEGEEATETYLSSDVSSKYSHSDVFRKSMFDVHSGTVQLADGDCTEYLIGEIHAYGRGNAGEHTDTERVDGSKKNYTENDYATFTIDADVDKETADVITAFAVQGKGADKWYKDENTGHTSLSSGRITLSGIEIRSSEGDWKYLRKLQKGLKLQVINFVVMDKIGGSEVADPDYYDQFKDECEIELDDLDELMLAKSKMDSSHILAASVSLATTKTHNDSILLTGYRDILQSWAEVSDTEGKWVETDGFGSIQYENYAKAEEAGDAKKVFTILDGEHRLTQSSYEGTKQEGTVWGDYWTIRGNYGRNSILNLNGLELMSTILSGQDAHLENFYLRNAKNWTMENKGTLTLDTMSFDSDHKLTIKNSGMLNIRGNMVLNGIIRSDEVKDEYSMVVDNQSTWTLKKDAAAPAAAAEKAAETTASGSTYVQILGAVENQNIKIMGEGAVSRTDKGTTDTYDTVVELRVLSDGKATEQYNAFKNNSLNMDNGKFILLGGLGMENMKLRHLTIGGGSIMVGSVDVDLKGRLMGTIKAGDYGVYDAAKGGHIFVDMLNLTSSSDEDKVTVNFTDSGIAGSVVPFADEKIGRTKGLSEIHQMYDKVIEWNVQYDYDHGDYIFTKTKDTLDEPTEPSEPTNPDVTDDEKKKLEEEKKELERKRKELEEWEKKLGDKENDLKKKRRELERKRKELEEWEKKLQEAENSVSDAEDALHKAQEELEQNRQELEKAKKDLEKAMKDLETAQDNVSKAKAELETARKNVEEAESALKKAQDELAEREKALAEKEAELKKREEELKKREEEEKKREEEEKKPQPTPPSSSVHFNPAIMAGPVAEMMGGYATMQEVFNHSFEHAEMFSATLNRARKERLASRLYTTVSPVKGGEAQSSGSTDGSASLAGFKGGMWVRPYSSFERMPVYDGIKADVSLYGALVGGDTRLTEYNNGWASVFSGFAGYTGSTQKFSRRDARVRTVQNGGVVGITETLYYRNFYTAITATIGSASAHANTTWGAQGARGGENFHMLMGGVASRSGYNIELAKGRYVIQPTWQMSFTAIDMPDYTNSDGVRVSSDTMYAFQIHPYVKAVMNTESGWDPYITAGYVHDFMAETSFHAQGYKLPSVSIDPYAEYGIGVQKTWQNTYTIYGQATGRSGGREGVEFSAGLRCAW